MQPPKTEALRERKEGGNHKKKAAQLLRRSQAAFCLVEKATDYVPVAFSTSPFVGMLLLIRKPSAPTQGTIHLSLLFLIELQI
jgi:hypothetical protein